MIYQFLYGRKNSGYCQINEDSIPFTKNELLKMEGLKSYSLVEGLNQSTLPEAFYFYNEKMGNRRVGILGVTSFVPAGTSEESGFRHTSFMHTYLLTELDYGRALHNSHELFRDRTFYHTVEEYHSRIEQNREGNVSSQFAKIDSDRLFEECSIDEPKLRDFILCCMEVFGGSTKRIYCYLSSNDNEGSLRAKQLMELVFSIMPPCLLTGAGFTTYSSTFYNPLSNPIPGNVGVIFIPDHSENRIHGIYEKDKNYIFDFGNNVCLQGLLPNSESTPIIDWMVGKIYGESTPMSHLNKFYDDLYKAVIPLENVKVAFIYSYCEVWLLWLMVSDNNRGFSEGDSLTQEDCNKIYAHHKKQFDTVEKRKRLALKVCDLLKSYEALTSYGMNKIYNIVRILFTAVQYNRDDLEWIDQVYTYGINLRNTIIQVLCDQCLKAAEKNLGAPGIIVITNYLYQNEEINEAVIHHIYEHRKYYSVAKVLIKTILDSLLSKKEWTEAVKLKKAVRYMEQSYERYPSLVLNSVFIDEMEQVIDKIMERPYSADRIELLNNLIGALNPVLKKAYLFIPQKLCYLVISKHVKSKEFDKITRKEINGFYQWMIDLRLSEYENTMPAIPLNRPLEKLSLRVHELKLQEVLLLGTVSDVNQELEISPDALIRKIGTLYQVEIAKLIKRYEGDPFDKDDYYDFFCAIFVCENEELMEKIAEQIIKVDGLLGLGAFCDRAEVKQRIDNGSVNEIIKSVVVHHLYHCTKRSDLKEPYNRFLESMGLSDYNLSDISSEGEEDIAFHKTRRRKRVEIEIKFPFRRL